MVRQLRPALVALALFTVLTGLLYPLAVTGASRLGLSGPANGSQVSLDGVVRGSSLIAQRFEGEAWFHPRPSAVDHDPTGSGASNLGPTNPDLLADIGGRAAAYRRDNDLGPDTLVPIDAVTASGSGLDPHISPRNAQLQAPRVARARNLPLSQVEALIAANTAGRTWTILGEPRVNVVTLNLALEELGR